MKILRVAQIVKWHGLKKKQDIMEEKDIVQTVVEQNIIIPNLIASQKQTIKVYRQVYIIQLPILIVKCLLT